MSVGKQIYAKLRGDRIIWMIVVVLSVYSILAVYSASTMQAFRTENTSVEGLMFSHAVKVLFGLFMVYVCSLVQYTQYKRMAPYLLILVIPLLVYTIGYGVELNNARRWVSVPIIGLQFQPSDLAKLALVIYVANAISNKQDYIDDFNDAFMPIIIPILIICGLIAPADLSTASVLFFTTLMMMFMGRVSLKYIALLLFLGIVLFMFLVTLSQFVDFVRADTWANRFKEFMDDTGGVNVQVEEAKIAIANGELFGVGPGNSMIKNYLPASNSDYIYSIICEEYGLIFGGLVILLLYVMLFFRCVSIVTRSPKAFGAQPQG